MWIANTRGVAAGHLDKGGSLYQIDCRQEKTSNRMGFGTEKEEIGG